MPDVFSWSASVERSERAVISAILNGADLDDITEIVSASDFENTDYKDCFAIMSEMRDKDIVVSPSTFSSELEMKYEDFFEKIGGGKFIESISNEDCSDMKYHAEVVKEASVRRKILKAGNELISISKDFGKPIQNASDLAEKALMSVSLNATESRIKDSGDLAEEVFREAMSRRSGDWNESERIYTGLKNVDSVTNGVYLGALLLVCGRPAQGKSTFCLFCTFEEIFNKRRPVLFFSLEMTARNLVQKVMLARSALSGRDFLTGTGSREDYSNFERARDDVKNAKDLMFFEECPSIRISELKSRARKFKAQHPDCRLIVVDYLQLVKGTDNSRNRSSVVNEVSEVADGLKALAMELNVVVMAAAQLNRNSESALRKNHEPMLSDLAQSGRCEQDADAVWLLYRESYYDSAKSDDPRMQVDIAKNRNGQTGKAFVNFYRECSAFEDIPFESEF